MKTAVIYARYSSDNQTEQSIEGQLRVCKDYAERNDIVILNTYIDRAMTGTNDNRPDFQKMINDSSNKDFQYIIVYKLDRFSRNKYETAKYKKILKDNGVKLLSAMENIPDTPEGIILESLLEGMAEYYSVELSQKIRRGMNETRLKGYYQGGSLAYGYKLNGRKIVINEEEAEVVKYIFNQYANGVYVRTIVEELQSQGLSKNGKPFPINTVYHILKSEKYIGKYSKNNQSYDNMYPRIIDDETFEKVRKKTKSNLCGKRSIKSIYLFKNKLKCGYCGQPISAETGTARDGTKRNYYKCLGIKKFHNNCIKETIKQDVLEEFILNTIIEELSKTEILNKMVNNLMQMQEKTFNSKPLLQILEKTKRQTETMLENIINAIQMGIMNKTTNKRMQELEDKIAEIEKQIAIEKCKENTKITKEDIKNYYQRALKEEPMTLINYLIKEIKLYNDKVEITFNSPIIKSPENHQGSFFISISKKLKTYHPKKQIMIFKNIEIKIYL